MNNSLSVSDVIKATWANFKPVWWKTAVVFFVFVAMSVTIDNFYKGSLIVGPILSFLVTSLSIYTMTRVSLMAMRKETIDWKNISNVNWEAVLYTAIFSILSCIIIGVGLVLLVIPGLIALARLGLGTLSLIDENLKPIEALKRSWALTKGHTIDILLVMFVFLALSIVIGVVTIGFGLLLMVPFMTIAMAHIYLVLRDNSIPQREHTEAPVVQA